MLFCKVTYTIFWLFCKSPFFNMSVSLQFRAALVFRYYSFVSTTTHLQCSSQHFARASKKPRIGEIVHRINLKSGGVSTFFDDNSLMKLITNRLCKLCLDIHAGHRFYTFFSFVLVAEMCKNRVRPMNWFRLPKQGASKNAAPDTKTKRQHQATGTKTRALHETGKTTHRLLPSRGPRHE